MEMDSRHYGQFRNYVDDLASGRLAIEPDLRRGVQHRPVDGIGVFRLGESSERIRDLQSVMDHEGYRAAGGGPLDRDGVYRPGMQGALLDFQRDHGIPQTGDIDPATLQFAPTLRPREMDRLDHVERGRMPRIDPQPRTAPGQPPLPDHRHDLPEDPASAVNQRQAQAGVRNPQLNQLLAAFRAGDSGAVSRAFNDISQSPQAQAWLQPGRDQLAAQAAQPPGQQEAAQSMQAPEPARG